MGIHKQPKNKTHMRLQGKIIINEDYITITIKWNNNESWYYTSVQGGTQQKNRHHQHNERIKENGSLAILITLRCSFRSDALQR